MAGYGTYGNEYSYTGGAGAGGGGGWMTGTQVGGTQASPGSASKDRSQTNTLRPVTIKQLLEAQAVPHKDGEYKVDDHELGHITVCGQILSISEQTTWNTYRLDDGSGTIEVKQWVDVQEPNINDRHPKLIQHMYVRVLGQLKTVMNSPKRYIAAANSIRPVEFNEVMFHMLEATVVHLHFTKGPKEKFMNTGNKGGTGDVHMGGMGMAQTHVATKMGGGPSGGGVINANFSHFSPMVRKVAQFLNTVDSDGEHVNVIAQRTGLSIREVHQARDELVGGGYAFVTVDDDTLALCFDGGLGG